MSTDRTVQVVTGGKALLMKRSTVTTLAILLAAGVLLFRPAAAQISSVSLRVDGLSCPFCAYSLEKQVKKVDGTTEPVINVEQGVVTLKPAGEAPVDFEALREAVRKAGFSPREIRIEGVGRIEARAGKATLVTGRGGQQFLLAANDVLAGLDAGRTGAVAFDGTVAARAKDDDPSVPPTLTLLSAAPVEKQEASE